MPEAEDEDFIDNHLEETLETAIDGVHPDADGETAPQEPPPGAAEEEEDEPAVDAGPGKIRRALGWLWKWHPLFFLGAALVLLVIAWRVYPEPEVNAIPPAEEFYAEGLDRLYRVMNPDLPLRGATPNDEALAARSSLLNLLVFYRASLRDYPEFINPHLLLGEADFRIARRMPELSDKYFADALEAYADALLWETREDDPRNLAVYVKHNFLDDGEDIPDDADSLALLDYFEKNQDEIALRRKRREDFIRFRQAEANLSRNRPELALPILEQVAQETRSRRRDELRGVIAGDPIQSEPERRAFELGPDEYFRLPLLLGRAYDGLGQSDAAKAEYMTFLASDVEGRERVVALNRLADISMEEGDVYRSVDPDTARRSFSAAATYFDEVAASPDAEASERDDAVLGSARAYSALAGLTPDTDKMVLDRIADAGSSLRGWLETFSGHALPQRTIGIPRALGAGWGSVENISPGPFAFPALVAGNVVDMAGGGVETPYSRRWELLRAAVDRYDRIAKDNAGAFLAARAAVMAARESWNLGMKTEAEARFRTLLDPLSEPIVNLASRLGLAEIALDRGDLEETSMLLLGGRAHPYPLWLMEEDADWQRFAARLGNPSNRAEENFWRRLWEKLTPEGRDIAAYAASGRRLDGVQISRLLKALNGILRQKDFYQPSYFSELDPDRDLAYLLDKNPETLLSQDIIWRNRLLLEASLPYELAQKASRNNIAYDIFPAYEDLDPSGLVPPGAVADILVSLARRQAQAAVMAPVDERLRLLLESGASYDAAINRYRADAGELLPELAAVYENQAEVREEQGNHLEALSLTARAARTYLAVSSRARGSPREMDSLLSAADAFFRAGLLERTVESLNLFLERFGYTAAPGSETSMSVARAENLLGRAYWFLDATDKAMETFGRNIKRRTPERYKSIYYLGRVMLDQANSPGGDPALLGDPARPLPNLDRDGDPIIESALQAFEFIRQDPGINPTARAWRWSAFDIARLAYTAAERARREDETRQRELTQQNQGQNPEQSGENDGSDAWLELYDRARVLLTEALERYPLRSNGGPGLSVRVEPEDYADLMASRYEAEYMLANTILRLADNRQDEALAALARAHLANLSDPSRYANALFDPSLDRFQLNAAVVREAIDGGNWKTGAPLPRTRLGDDEGPTHSPQHLRELLKNSLLLLAAESFQAAERLAAADNASGAEGLYRQAYDVYQALYDRFGPAYGPQAMLGMADILNRLGQPEAAANHYRMAENIARMQPENVRSDGMLDIGPGFWGQQAAGRLRDQSDGLRVP